MRISMQCSETPPSLRAGRGFYSRPSMFDSKTRPTMTFLLSPGTRSRCAALLGLPIALAWPLGVGAESPQAVPPVRSVPSVDLARYAGTWYEVARLPNRFQSKCAGHVTATYAPLADGSVSVINRCKRADGQWDMAEGRAVLADPQSAGARLKVSFLPPGLRWIPFGRGNYWVVRLDAQYRYAVVSEPSREYLWVLSRTPTLDAATDASITEWLRANAYPADRLVRTPQSPPSP
jgi:apolipoprotein D and lipocalin family protein